MTFWKRQYCSDCEKISGLQGFGGGDVGCLGMWRRLNRWSTREFYSILLVSWAMWNKKYHRLGGGNNRYLFLSIIFRYLFFLIVLEADCLAEPWGRQAVWWPVLASQRKSSNQKLNPPKIDLGLDLEPASRTKKNFCCVCYPVYWNFVVGAEQTKKSKQLGMTL